MKRAAKTLLCFLLCAVMIIPGSLFIGAEEHVHEDAEEEEITSGTEEQIEALPCEAKNAPGGKHVLATSFDIVISEDRTRLVRGEADVRVFGESCTTNGGGASRRACKYCSKWFTVIVPGEEAKGHTFDKTEEVFSECDKVTYQVRECSVCGFVEVKAKDSDASVDLSKHNAGTPETKTVNDCSTDSVTITKCKDCDLVLSCVDNGPKGHSGSWQTTKNASCSEEGESTFKCGRCDYSATRKIPKTSHIKGTRYIVEPTCETGGTKYDVCIYCNTVLSENEEVPALGHDWVEKAPSLCDQKPYKVCTRCGKTEDLESGEPLSHTWGENETVEPTCAKEGYTFHRCTKCGVEERIGDPVPATGNHEWTEQGDVISATCGTTGQYREKCAVCGELGELHQTPPTGEHKPEADDGDCTTPVLCKVCSLVVTAANESHNFKYTRVPAPQNQTEYFHTKKCTNSGCTVNETEKCSGEDDGDCTTPVKCSLCGGEIKSGSIHLKSGVFKEYPGEEDLYHIELCKHSGCNGTVGEKSEHTYVDGKCTVCGHVDGREHIPDGVWKSDGDFHWQTCKLCGEKTMIESHDKTETSPYDGDCTKAVTCTVCGHEVRAASSHSYDGPWEHDSEFHFRVCTNPGCTVREEVTHTPKSDGDCTTPDKCTECGYEVVKGGEAHSWVVAEDGHTDTYHKLVCSNEGCTQTSTAEHKAGIAATCVSKAECSECHMEFGEVDPNKHVGGTVIKNQKPATEEEEGYTGDTYCASCDALLAKGEPIDKLPPSHKHEYNILVSDDENHWYECSCGEKDESSVTAHTYGAWESNAEFHFRVCTNPDCTAREEAAHTPKSDGDCTTPDKCSTCGYEVVKGGEAHSWVVAEDGHTDTHHKFVCSNEGCTQTSMEEHKAGIAATCTSKAECSECHMKFGEVDPDNHVGGIVVKDQKPATEEEEGYTGDTYCAGCGALLEKGEKIDKLPPSHKHEYNVLVSDGEHHWYECSCGEKNEDSVAAHTYGSWEYVDEATHARKCSVCEYAESERHEHGEDPHDCTKGIVCVDCKAVVVKAAATEHNFNGRAVGTAEGHTVACTNPGCEQTTAVTPHSGGTPSCVSGGHCEECGYEYLPKDPNAHIGGTVIKDQKPATEEEEGYTGDTYCASCGALLKKGEKIDKLPPSHKHEYNVLASDGEYHWYECSCGEKDEESISVHAYGSWGYVDEATHSRKCTVCGYTDSERHEHGEDPHDCTKSITCVDCGAVVVEATATEHNFNGRAIGTAEGHTVACTNPGCEQTTALIPHSGGISSCESGGHCEVCDYEYLLKDPNVHTGGTEVRDHKDPTTTEKGYTGDTYCLGCGELIEKGTDIDKLPEEHTHAFGEWMTDATHHWKACECGAVESYEEHTFYKGICAVCGAVDPSYTEPPKALVDRENGFVGTFDEENAESYKDIELIVEKLDETDEDYAGIKNTIGSMYEEFIPYDVTLFNVTDGIKVQPTGMLTISIPIPAGWSAEKTLVFHVDGDKIEAVKVTVSEDKAYVSFTVDHLSKFVLANAESEISAVPPQTGDMSMIASLSTVLALAVVGMAATVFTKKRHH